MASASPTRAASLDPDARNAFLAAVLGWTMDAFDYFLVVLVYAEIAKDFGVSLERMAFLTTVTLIMRPVGALLFGVWADRIGRRTPLIVDVAFYSIVAAGLSACQPESGPPAGSGGRTETRDAAIDVGATGDCRPGSARC